MTRRPLSLLSLLALLALNSAGAAAEPVDLFRNGGFEEGLVGWTADAGQQLVAEAAKAHSGRNCLLGEVTEPNRALRLRRNVPVKPGNRYEFQVWARATPGVKLVLWMTPPGGKREMVVSWPKLTGRWQHYTAPITVSAAGLLKLEVIAPSSMGASPGRIWIDDLALLETPMPALTCASEGVGFNDEPALSQPADGSLWLAWNSFREGADSLQVARFQPQSKGFQRQGVWQPLAGEGTYVLGLASVSAGPRPMFLYAAERDKNWDVYALACARDGPRQPVAIDTDPAVDVNPAGAWQDETLWVAWESNRAGCRRVYIASVADGRPSAPEALSPPGVSSYDPSVAVLANGQVCVGWYSFRENNYDIYLRRRSGNAWGPVERLTKAPTIDRHPQLIAAGDELVVIYENAQVKEYHIGATSARHLVVAKVGDGGLLAPKSENACPLSVRSEGASAVFDPSGRLWIAMLMPRLPRAGWDTYLTCFDGRRWQKPSPVSPEKGLDRTPGLAWAGDRPIVAMQADDLPVSWTDVDKSATAKSNVYLAAVTTGPLPPPEARVWEPLVESEEPFAPAAIRVERGEDRPTPSITYQGQTLNLYYGNLHEHSDVSVCNRPGDQTAEESYQHMRDIARHDFACVTDHDYNFNEYLWYYAAKLARIEDDPGRFLTFLGEEWTSSIEEYDSKHPYGFYGHRNLILGDCYFPRWWNSRNRQTPAEVWEDLRRMKADFIHIPHQLADTGNVPTDWSFTDEQAQPVAEIFQTRGSYEYRGAPREAERSTPAGWFLQDAWARGIVIGVIASPDHGGGYGKACVFAPDLSRRSILAALRARRSYGTTAAKIFLDVRVDGHLMGEKLSELPGRQVTVEIKTSCPADIDRIEVFRNNRIVSCSRPEGREAELRFVDRQPLDTRSYYYVRVIQKDTEIAWSSPVWFGAK